MRTSNAELICSNQRSHVLHKCSYLPFCNLFENPALMEIFEQYLRKVLLRVAELV